MSIAPNRAALKRRLDRYFWANSSAEMVLLREIFSSHFDSFDRVAVLGGLVRDFARAGRSAFRSDVDLVIEAPAERVSDLANILKARPNRFGGFGLRSGLWRIDFWALETTWAARHAGVPVKRIEDVLQCTFFDWDAAAYDLGSRQVLYSAGYLDRIKSAMIDINLAATPSVEGNLLRSIRRIVLWHLKPGPALSEFIEKNLDDSMLYKIQNNERRLPSCHVTLGWKNARIAHQYLLEPDWRTLETKQLDLDFPVP